MYICCFGRDQCVCLPGTTRTLDGQCIIGQLYALPSLTTCPLRTYPRGVLERCSSCRVDPYPECAVGWYTLGNGSCGVCLRPDNASFTSNGKSIGVATSCGWACNAGFYLKGSVAFVRQCQMCTNMPTNVDASYVYPVSNAQLEAPNGCLWGCKLPYKMQYGSCVACNFSNTLHVGMPCVHPLWKGLNGSSWTAPNGGARYKLAWVNATTSLDMGYGATLDVLLVGGGGAGGGVASGIRGAGGGGGGGQIKVVYGVAVAPGMYVAQVGQGGQGALGTYGTTGGSSTFYGLSALYGGMGGLGTLDANADGKTGASSGGSGSAGYGHVYRASNLSGWPGGADVVGCCGGGGGGAGGAGLDSGVCKGGAGGAGALVGLVGAWFAAGGLGGVNQTSCLNATLSLDAAGNTGNGGGGASGLGPLRGGNGGSGVIVFRYVDEVCSCL